MGNTSRQIPGSISFHSLFPTKGKKTTLTLLKFTILDKDIYERRKHNRVLDKSKVQETIFFNNAGVIATLENEQSDKPLNINN